MPPSCCFVPSPISLDEPAPALSVLAATALAPSSAPLAPVTPDATSVHTELARRNGVRGSGAGRFLERVWSNNGSATSGSVSRRAAPARRQLHRLLPGSDRAGKCEREGGRRDAAPGERRSGVRRRRSRDGRRSFEGGAVHPETVSRRARIEVDTGTADADVLMRFNSNRGARFGNRIALPGFSPCVVGSCAPPPRLRSEPPPHRFASRALHDGKRRENVRSSSCGARLRRRRCRGGS